MMRSFPTRIANSLTRVVLLVPWLLICLACATPFPVENLEKGMTTETVRENFGAPEYIGTKRGSVVTRWYYVDEEQAWFLTIMSSTAFLPHCLLLTAATMPFGAEHWCADFIPTVEEGEVVLHFEDERLARWEVIEPVPVVSSGYTYQDPFPSTTLFPTRDIKHHKKGHKHHHGHGC